jgi:sugar phosphate permease
MAPPRRVLPLLLVAYATFYLCRANVEPALNLLAVEQKYDNEQIGSVMGVALGVYAFGKLVLGPLADVWGGKVVLVLSLFSTAILSFSIALSDAPHRLGPTAGLFVVGGLVVANRFVQAGGWGGLVDVVAVTFDASRRGTIMGILATSYDVGNVLALVLSAAIVEAGGGWRSLFVINPALVLVVGVVVKFALPDAKRPERTDDKTPDAPPADDEEPAALRAIFARLARQPSFWFATALSFLLTFVRAGFMTWTPRFLYEVALASGAHSPMSGSIAKSAFFGVAGIIGSVVTGRLSDRLGPGRRTPLMAASLVLLFGCVLALAHVGVRSTFVASLGVAACGLFLLGPYSLLSGAISLDVAGRRGGATAAGVIDAVGYAGASLAAFVLGSVSKRAGWTAAFDVVASVTLAALLLTLAWNARVKASKGETLQRATAT